MVPQDNFEDLIWGDHHFKPRVPVDRRVGRKSNFSTSLKYLNDEIKRQQDRIDREYKEKKKMFWRKIRWVLNVAIPVFFLAISLFLAIYSAFDNDTGFKKKTTTSEKSTTMKLDETSPKKGSPTITRSP